MPSTTTARPPAGYLGGKRNLAKRLCALIEATPHREYIEPFVGMGGVFLRRPTPASFRSSPRIRVSWKHGSGSWHRSLTPNPRFYEMVMGWPTGWTAPGAPVTGYAAWLRLARGQFSKQLTSWTPGEVTGARGNTHPN